MNTILRCLFVGQIFLCLLISWNAERASAQTGNTPLESPVSPVSQQEIQQKRLAFEQAVEEWRGATKDVVRALWKFKYGERELAAQHRDEWQKAFDRGNEIRDRVADLALDYFSAARGQKESEAAINIVTKMVKFDVENGRFEKAYRASKRLIEFRNNDQPLLRHALLCMQTNRFEEADEIRQSLLTQARNEFNEIKGLDNEIEERDFKKFKERLNQESFAGLDSFLKDWKREQKLRAEEKDTNPRARIKTSKGTLLVELFEKQAPETVANFIFLSKQGFYDGVKFHRVISGFMGQTGRSDETSDGGPGYTIYDEYGREDARKHFRGVLSMANTGAPNSASSEFFITFCPRTNLDGGYTVFGRIIEGDAVLERIKTTYTIDDENNQEVPVAGVTPDEILKVEIIRDSGKDYQPRKVKLEK